MPRIDSSKPVHWGYTGTLYVNYPEDMKPKPRRMSLEDIISKGNAFYKTMEKTGMKELRK